MILEFLIPGKIGLFDQQRIGQQELVEIGGAQLDANAYTFPEQPEIAMEIMEGHNPEEFNPILNLVAVGMFLAAS